MKEKIIDVLKIIWEIIKIIGVIIIIGIVLKSCDKNQEAEAPVINVCGSEIDIGDYYTDKIEWNRFEKDINELCEEHYYENPEDICNDYISDNKEEICVD